MPKSQKTKMASKWLASGLVPADRSEELLAASVLLASDIALEARLEDIGTQKMAVDVEMAVVIAADDAGDIDLLVHLRDKGQHKASAKHAKKLLYRAKQRGASIPEEQTREAVSLSQSPEPLPSLCSSFDRNGGQVVLWGGWSAEDGSWALLGIIHDQRGLESVAWLPRLSRSRLRSVMDDLRERRGGELIEVSERFAIDRFRVALQSAEAQQTRIDGDKTRVRRMLEQSDGDAQLQANEANVVDDQALQACSELLDESLFDGWLTTLDAALDQVESELKSQIEAGSLTVESQAVTSAAVLVLADTFDDEARRRLAAQMQINSLLLSQTERSVLANCAATIADALVDPKSPERASPFFEAVLERLAPIEDFIEQLSAHSTDTTESSASDPAVEPEFNEPASEATEPVETQVSAQDESVVDGPLSAPQATEEAQAEPSPETQDSAPELTTQSATDDANESIDEPAVEADAEGAELEATEATEVTEATEATEATEVTEATEAVDQASADVEDPNSDEDPSQQSPPESTSK